MPTDFSNHFSSRQTTSHIPKLSIDFKHRTRYLMNVVQAIACVRTCPSRLTVEAQDRQLTEIEKMTPQIEEQAGVTIVVLGEEYENLDETILDELKDVLLNAVSNANPPLVVIDLANTNFFGSAFLGILFRAWQRLSARDGGRFGICCLTPNCQEVFDVTQVKQLWDIFETRADAIQAFSAS